MLCHSPNSCGDGPSPPVISITIFTNSLQSFLPMSIQQLTKTERHPLKREKQTALPFSYIFLWISHVTEANSKLSSGQHIWEKHNLYNSTGPVKFRCMLINGENIKVEKVKLLRQKLKLHLELSQVRQFNSFTWRRSNLCSRQLTIVRSRLILK